MDLSYFYSFFIYSGIITICLIYNKTIKIPSTLIIDYNICNALINVYIVYGLYPYICNSSFGMYKDYDEFVDFYIYMYYFSKYLQFGNTIMLILKGHLSQINLQHLYYHSTIGVFWYWIWRDCSYVSASVSFGALFNSFVSIWIYIDNVINEMGYNNKFKNILTFIKYIVPYIILSHSIYWINCYPENEYFGIVQTNYTISILMIYYFESYIFNFNKLIYYYY